jgi:hypothetical protein
LREALFGKRLGQEMLSPAIGVRWSTLMTSLLLASGSCTSYIIGTEIGVVYGLRSRSNRFTIYDATITTTPP